MFHNPFKMDHWCRVCLDETKGELLSIEHEVEGLSIDLLITSCSGITVEKSDSLPGKCCERCVKSLYIAYSIAEQCRVSDEKLRNLNKLSTESNKAETVHDVCAEISNDSSDDAENHGENNTHTDTEKTCKLITTCCACRADFETVEALADHVVKVHEPDKTDNDSKKPYQCDICYKRYFKKTSLNRHKRLGTSGLGIRIAQIEQPIDYRCCGCRKDFLTKEELQNHSVSEHSLDKVHDESKPFQCDICFKRYSNKTSLGRHFRERLVNRRPRSIRRLASNQCCGCRQTFNSKELLSQHARQIHEPDRMEDLGGLKPFECSVCFSRYSTQEAFNRHKAFLHLDQLYQCQQCEKFFVKRIMLRIHERKFHNGIQQDVVGPYQCTRCGKTFMQSSSLTNHEKTHHSDERFECYICQKLFLSKGNLQTHFKLHSKPTAQRKAQYECPICRCRFKTPNYLDIHARTHSGEKPYTCKYCSKQFAHASGHKRHLLTHTGLKPFSCRFCGREFSNRTNMHIHEKSHGTERNAKCDVCGKEFVHDRYLRKHLKRHSSS
ncbi:zinc finger protein 93-like [Toxorhynchites rutilus septentrionalis]|uniref:zinc finger protein 93-like n=1 Tax=Toxorhynchites rutilus septentrionalis TaxID=329112 RepID=UPI00247A935D|nr:zinc finger protein 93-like [Toxorhynchites rutilus septentrionalis]